MSSVVSRRLRHGKSTLTHYVEAPLRLVRFVDMDSNNNNSRHLLLRVTIIRVLYNIRHMESVTQRLTDLQRASAAVSASHELSEAADSCRRRRYDSMGWLHAHTYETC